MLENGHSTRARLKPLPTRPIIHSATSPVVEGPAASGAAEAEIEQETSQTGPNIFGEVRPLPSLLDIIAA